MSKCEICNKEFKQRFGREKYCSRECFYKSRRGINIYTKCGKCGEKLQIKSYNYRGEGRHFCSRECYYQSLVKHKPIIKICAWCGEEYESRTDNKAIHCSVDCSNKTNAIRRRETVINEQMQDLQDRIDLGEQDLVC